MRGSQGFHEFKIVSDRIPRIYSVCSYCGKPIVVGYLRELALSLTYCDNAGYWGRESTHAHWSFTEFDDFAFGALQFAIESARAHPSMHGVEWPPMLQSPPAPD